MSSTKRDDFPERVKLTVAGRAGHRCSKPDCRRITIGPHSDPNKTLSTGRACHISGAAPGGPRYDDSQTSEERRGIENAIWLCADCSDIVDKDESRYPPDDLLRMKSDHEAWIKQGGMVPDLPLIEISTGPGISLGEEAGSEVTSEDINHLRQHRFRIRNPNDVEIKNIVAHVQLPEPVTKTLKIARPAGVEIDWQPKRMDLRAFARGQGAKVVRTGPPSVTSIYTLNIEKIPAGSSVEIDFLTTIDEWPRQIPFSSDSDAFELYHYVDGTFQYDFEGITWTRPFLAVVEMASESRSITVIETLDDYGERKPMEIHLFS